MAVETPSSPIRSCQRMLRIVEVLKELEGATTHELADYLDIPNSSAHNHLKTLEYEGYVVKRGYTYEVGLRFIDLGGFARSRNPLYTEAKEMMMRLSERTGELTSVFVEEHGRGFFLARSRGDKAVNLKDYVGQCIELHTTSVGKVILAYMPEERLHATLDRYGLEQKTEHTITDREELYEHLEDIRERGAAVGMEERIPGLCAVSVPIIPEDEIIGSIGVAGPTARMNSQDTQEQYIAELREVQNVLELNLKRDYA